MSDDIATAADPFSDIFDPDLAGDIFHPDLVGGLLDNADRRNLRKVSKRFNRAFFNSMQCADDKELQSELHAMRSEPEPCKNTAKVIYNSEKGIQRAIMCAIMSVDQKLHVYVNQEHLTDFLPSESVKCFDRNYALRLTLLCGGDPQGVLQPGELRCAGGFRALKGGWARNGRLRDREGVQVVRFTGNTHVAHNAFVDNESLMELLDVNTIEYINPRAFQRCSALAQLGDLSSLKTIGKSAFYGTQLTQLGDMRALTDIGGAAFVYTPLTQLGDMPKLETIGDWAFGITPLTQLGDMPALITIGNNAFFGTPLTQLGDLSALKTIGDLAFRGTQLTQLGDMRSLETIGDGAFEGTQLTQLGDMRSLETIGHGAFKRTQLTQLVNMPELRTISYRAFQGCTDLETVHLPKTLTHVGFDAFDGCPLGQLSVETGADFVCGCLSLASKLQALDNVHVEYVTSYRVQISTV